jgi:hypothetical protein
MKYISIRSPEGGPFGETLRDRRVRAMVAASFVNRPGGGWVESVLTPATQRLGARFMRCTAAFVLVLKFVNLFDRAAYPP